MSAILAACRAQNAGDAIATIADSAAEGATDSASDSATDSAATACPQITVGESGVNFDLSCLEPGPYTWGWVGTGAFGWEGEDCIAGPGPSGHSGAYDICHDNLPNQVFAIRRVDTPEEVVANYKRRGLLGGGRPGSGVNGPSAPSSGAKTRHLLPAGEG